MSLLREKGIDFDTGIDPEENIWKQYAEGSIPKNFIIGKEGVIVYTSTGNDGISVGEVSRILGELIR